MQCHRDRKNLTFCYRIIIFRRAHYFVDGMRIPFWDIFTIMYPGWHYVLCILWVIYLNNQSNSAYYLIKRLSLLFNRIFSLKNSKEINREVLKYVYSCRANWALSKNMYMFDFYPRNIPKIRPKVVVLK